MTIKKTKQAEINAKKLEAIIMYNAGFTTREIGKKIGRSHSWVAKAVKETTIKDLTKNLQK